MAWTGAAAGRPRRTRGLAWAMGGALLALLAVLGLRALEARRALSAAHPPVEGSLAVAGLRAPLEIVRDRRGVPHVWAGSEEDAWFALGFVHAQDRAAQMLWLRGVAQGRSAEWVGDEEALGRDRLARTLGLARAADADAGRLEGRTRSTLEAYAAGVNARLVRLREGLEAPPLALGLPVEAVEPWAPAHSLALVKLHAWGLSGTLEESAVLAELIERFGGFGARPFFPAGVGFDAVPPVPDPTLAGALTGAAREAAALRRATGLQGRSVGSTAFVTAGALAARGGPLLAADAHFAAQTPAHYYEAHLHGGGLDVAGATLPGIPGFWIGFTPEVAWAATHVPVLVADLFVETLHPRDPTRYRLGSRWSPLATRAEEIHVRGGATARFEVAETERGPLLGEAVDGLGRTLALRWPGALPGRGVESLLRMASARSAEELRAALRVHHEPVIQVVYADRRGRGGSQLAGWIPRRALPTGGVPVPARNPAFAWREAIDFEALPHRALSREHAFLVAADGPLEGRPARVGIEVLWRSGHREGRVASLLREAQQRGPLDLSSLVAIQRDVHSSGAREVIDLALELAGEPRGLSREAREVAATLRDWDGRASPESRGAAVYHVFLGRLLRALLEPAMGEALLERYLALRGVSPAKLVRGVLHEAREAGPEASDWAEPEAVRAAVRRSLGDAWMAMSVSLSANQERWAWGNLLSVRFEPLSPGGRRGGLRGLGPYSYGGDGSSVQVAEYHGLRSFDARVVATYRFLADASELGQALSSLSPGQSEHPGHPHAQDGLTRWMQGRPSLLSTSAPVIEDGEVARLALEPAS